MRKSRFILQEELRLDKNQTLFSDDLNIKKNDFRNAQLKEHLNPDNNVMCPFCLYVAKAIKFYQFLTKQKLDKRFGKCPDCGTLATWKSLYTIIKMKPEEFAKWVYEYRLSGFWKKCTFEKFKTRLYHTGLSFEFWEEYKKLKGESTINDPVYQRVKYILGEE